MIGGPAATIVGRPGPAAQAERQIATITQITDRRDAAAQRRLAGTGHRPKNFAVPAVSQVANGVGAGVKGQMDMRVDQPGQQRRTGQIDDGRTLRC